MKIFNVVREGAPVGKFTMDVVASIAENLAAAACATFVVNLYFNNHEYMLDAILYLVFSLLVLASIKARSVSASKGGYDGKVHSAYPRDSRYRNIHSGRVSRNMGGRKRTKTKRF